MCEINLFINNLHAKNILPGRSSPQVLLIFQNYFRDFLIKTAETEYLRFSFFTAVLRVLFFAEAG